MYGHGHFRNFSHVQPAVHVVTCSALHTVAVLVDTDAKRKAVAAAGTAEELWKAMGVDCWAVVPVASLHRGGHDLEGTRLTVRCSRAPPARVLDPGALSSR
jgi:hypothetical protein